jgi:6-phosphogluconolactonase
VTTLHTFADADAVAEAAARAVAEAAAEAVAERGRFLLVLAGGSTPRGVYLRLAAEHARPLPRDRVHLFWGDERAVPPDHPQSNFGMAEASLLRHLRLPPPTSTGSPASTPPPTPRESTTSDSPPSSGLWIRTR